MTAANRDEAAWALYGSVSVGNEDGAGREVKADAKLARRARGFGVVGSLCPDRHYGFATAMAGVVAVEAERVGDGDGREGAGEVACSCSEFRRRCEADG